MRPIFLQILQLLGLGHDAKAIAITSAILMVAAILSVIVVGAIINGIEKIQITLLSKVFGVKGALFICNYLTLPGTIIHESAHALLCVVTGAKVTEISFLDTKGDTLGHVSYINCGPAPIRAIQDSLCACAPVFAGLLCDAYIINRLLNVSDPIWGKVILVYLAISIIDHTSMSSIDIKHYFQGIWAVAPIVFGAFFVYGTTIA